MDPIVDLFSGAVQGGAVLFVFWKLATKAMSTWKETSKDRTQLELERLTKQHEQYSNLTASVQGMSDRVHENTSVVRELVAETRVNGKRMEDLIDCITPPGGMRVNRRG